MTEMGYNILLHCMFTFVITNVNSDNERVVIHDK